MAEDYPGSPYNYTLLNPVKLVDPDGRSVDWIEVIKNDNGTYDVKDGEANSDRNVYVVDDEGNRTGEVLGEMVTDYSLFDESEDGFDVVEGAEIDINSTKGQDFLDDLEKNDPSLLGYM